MAITDFDSASRDVNLIAVASGCGLLIAVGLEWIYFHVEASRHFKHALRRHPGTSFLWVWSHLPLHACVVLTGASMSVLILKIGKTGNEQAIIVDKDVHHAAPPTSTQTTFQQRLFFASSFAMTMFLLACIGILHQSMEKGQKSFIPKKFRIACRVLLGALIFVIAVSVPDEHIISHPLTLLALVAALMALQIILEE